MNKTLYQEKIFKYLGSYGTSIYTKLKNICGKTGQYDVPSELFQKRTKRNNRSLIPWRTINENRISLDQLETFEGGVVVEFLNNDYFNKKNRSNPVFLELCNKIGSDDNVSAIITIHSEGDSSSSIQREAFEKLTNNTVIKYKGKTITVTKSNFKDFIIKQDIPHKGYGNETWSGFLYISIRGGQQDTVETHSGLELTLFNPACEYASKDVCTDINLALSFFALFSIDITKLNDSKKREQLFAIRNLSSILKDIEYDSPAYSGNLLDFCNNHYSILMKANQLTDPIQTKRIDIMNFDITTRTPDSIDITHSEAVVHNKFYWDKKKKCILSPARPTNMFWSFHLSNMMQQNYTLEEYFKYEEERFKQRKKLLKRQAR